MIGRVVFGKDRAHYFLDGQEVAESAFRESFPDRSDDADSGPCSLSGVREMHSEALAVHPKQIKEATENAKKKGVPTEFDQHGRPVFTSRAHQRAYGRAYGFVNKDDNWSARNYGVREKTPEERAKEYFDG